MFEGIESKLENPEVLQGMDCIILDDDGRPQQRPLLAGYTEMCIPDEREFTYVGNIADGCIKAAKNFSALSSHQAPRYVDKPISLLMMRLLSFREQCGVVLGGLGYEKPSIRVPFLFCNVIAVMLESVVSDLSSL